MDKKTKNTLVILGVIILIAVIVIAVIILLKPKDENAQTPKSEHKNAPWIGVLTAVAGSQQAKDLYCKMFPKSCEKKYCDCDRPGYAVDGVADPICDEEKMLFEQECK